MGKATHYEARGSDPAYKGLALRECANCGGTELSHYPAGECQPSDASPPTEEEVWLTGYRPGSVMDIACRRFCERFERKPDCTTFMDLHWVNGYAKCLLDCKMGIATPPEGLPPEPVAHSDPTGTTREPPHCPTCGCGLPGEPVPCIHGNIGPCMTCNPGTSLNQALRGPIEPHQGTISETAVAQNIPAISGKPDAASVGRARTQSEVAGSNPAGSLSPEPGEGHAWYAVEGAAEGKWQGLPVKDVICKGCGMVRPLLNCLNETTPCRRPETGMANNADRYQFLRTALFCDWAFFKDLVNRTADESEFDAKVDKARSALMNNEGLQPAQAGGEGGGMASACGVRATAPCPSLTKAGSES